MKTRSEMLSDKRTGKFNLLSVLHTTSRSRTVGPTLISNTGHRAIHRRPAFSRTMWIPCHMHFCISHSWFRRPHWCKWLPVEQTYCYGSLRFTSQRFPQGVGQGAMNQGTRGYCKLECVSSRQYVWWLLLFVGDIQRRPASSKTIWMPNHMYVCAL